MAGLVALVLCTVMMGITFTIFLCQPEMERLVRSLGRGADRDPVAGPPIEDIARALRRLRAETRTLTQGTPMARRRGTMAAYDDLLAQAARALGVPDTLAGLPEGTDREAERLRMEHLLREAGLRLG